MRSTSESDYILLPRMKVRLKSPHTRSLCIHLVLLCKSFVQGWWWHHNWFFCSLINAVGLNQPWFGLPGLASFLCPYGVGMAKICWHNALQDCSCFTERLTIHGSQDSLAPFWTVIQVVARRGTLHACNSDHSHCFLALKTGCLVWVWKQSLVLVMAEDRDGTRQWISLKSSGFGGKSMGRSYWWFSSATDWLVEIAWQCLIVVVQCYW